MKGGKIQVRGGEVGGEARPLLGGGSVPLFAPLPDNSPGKVAAESLEAQLINAPPLGGLAEAGQAQTALKGGALHPRPVGGGDPLRGEELAERGRLKGEHPIKAAGEHALRACCARSTRIAIAIGARRRGEASGESHGGRTGQAR